MVVRILSALVGIIIGVVIILIDNVWVFCAVLGILGAIGTYELTRAVGCEKHKLLRWVCVCFSACVPFLLVVEMLQRFAAPAAFLFVVALFVIQLARHDTVRTSDIAICGAAAMLIPAALSCILFVRYTTEDTLLGVSLIFYILFCAWFGDSGAYFVGTFLGKHKLCPKISPKKTVEGLIGGIITVGVVAFIHCLIFNLFIAQDAQMSYFVLVPVAMAASGMGVVGDLSASVIKRHYDVKDFGNLMPGHGGMLDRFDSVLFTAPFLYVVFSFISPAL